MSDAEPDTDTYALRAAVSQEIPAPDLPYKPPAPKSYRPRIGLIGAGGIASSHLDAYRTAGWDVVAICNRTRAKAEAKAAEYFPEARVSSDPQDVLSDPSIDVVDITPHPVDRIPLIEAALNAGKHVLSQKPFVLDLDTGERLADLADANAVKLAVNQNGRWAPHMAWMREAVGAGLIGDVIGAHVAIHWDHRWIAGTPFEKVDDLIFYDFAIHWFDFLMSVAGPRVESVVATKAFATGQAAKVPLLAQALVRLDGGQASLVFDGATPIGPHDSTYIAGTLGSLRSEGPDLGTQSVTLSTAKGVATPHLEGTWFNDGFRGAMGELLSAIEDQRTPSNNGRDNLNSLALAFAAIESVRTKCEVAVGSARKLVV